MKRLTLLGLLGLAVACGSLPSARAQASEEDPTIFFGKLLEAIESNNYSAFVANGTDEFKTGMTTQMLQSVSVQFAPRLQKGYQRVYLGELRQQGSQVYLWKLVFKDGGDDTLVKLVIKKGKVAGFWLQ